MKKLKQTQQYFHDTTSLMHERKASGHPCGDLNGFARYAFWKASGHKTWSFPRHHQFALMPLCGKVLLLWTKTTDPFWFLHIPAIDCQFPDPWTVTACAPEMIPGLSLPVTACHCLSLPVTACGPFWSILFVSLHGKQTHLQEVVEGLTPHAAAPPPPEASQRWQSRS